MAWLDKTISWFAPAAGLRRIRARALTATAELAYESAKTGRRTAGWITSGNSGNAELVSDLKTLRERSRAEIRDNHLAQKAQIEYVTRIIGTGPEVQSENAAAMELWRRWQPQCSAEGLPHFAAVAALVARTVFESGECLVRRRTRTASVASGMAVPIQLQVMEPDFLDMSKTASLQDGGYIIQGVEFNSWGQRVAYWLFPQHPGEVITTGAMMRSGLTSQRIPASEILHIRDLTTMRAGQVHGVPALAPVLLVMRDLADWEDAEILRKKTESCLAAIVVDPTGASNPNGDTLAPKITDAYGNTVEQFQPGMVAYGNSGFDVKFNTPSYAGGYEEYKRSRVRDIAIGLGWIYELLSGDQSQTNYSSYRAGLLGVADRVESLQYNIYIPQLCEPVWEWFVEAAVDFAGLSGDVAAQWTPNAFDLLDREAEAKADGLMLSNGTMTWPQAVARQGYDPEKQLQEIETWKPRLDKAGVSFNPKQGGANGQNQTASPAA